MTIFQEVVRLKIERPTATRARQDAIDQRCRELANLLTHEEAVYLVRKYELRYKEA